MEEYIGDVFIVSNVCTLFRMMSEYYIQVVIFIFSLGNNILIRFKRIRHVLFLWVMGLLVTSQVVIVKIEMLKGVIHILGAVAYASKMLMNLISLGWLDSIGCRFSMADKA